MSSLFEQKVTLGPRFCETGTNSDRYQSEDFLKCMFTWDRNETKAMFLQTFMTAFRGLINFQRQYISCSSHEWFVWRDFAFSWRKFPACPSSNRSELIRVGPAPKMSETGPRLFLEWVSCKLKQGFTGGAICSRVAGGTVIVHMSFTTVTRVRFLLHAVIWLKLPLSHVRRVLSSLSLPIIAGFLQVLRFPPVVTLDPWGVALTGPLGRTA